MLPKCSGGAGEGEDAWFVEGGMTGSVCSVLISSNTGGISKQAVRSRRVKSDDKRKKGKFLRGNRIISPNL